MTIIRRILSQGTTLSQIEQLPEHTSLPIVTPNPWPTTLPELRIDVHRNNGSEFYALILNGEGGSLFAAITVRGHIGTNIDPGPLDNLAWTINGSGGTLTARARDADIAIACVAHGFSEAELQSEILSRLRVD